MSHIDNLCTSTDKKTFTDFGSFEVLSTKSCMLYTTGSVKLRASKVRTRRRDKSHRMRYCYTDYQEESLKSMFAINRDPDIIAREAMAYSIDLPQSRVKVTFFVHHFIVIIQLRICRRVATLSRFCTLCIITCYNIAYLFLIADLVS